MDIRDLDFYETYESDRYIHFRYVPTGRYEIVEVKRGNKIVKVRQPIMEKQILSFKEVKELNLDNYGQDARTSSRDFTLVHNYLLDFWSAIIGSDAIMLYIHLQRYCYGEKDFCFPNMETIRQKMKKGSKSTIIKNMEILEEHGFIVKINRLDKKRNNSQASPFFKVRRYVPLLSQELIEKLPEDIRKEHDEFLARANGIELNDDDYASKIVDDLMVNAKTMKAKKELVYLKVLKQEGKYKEYICANMPKEQNEKHDMILKELEEKVSKPAFDTWFRNSIMLLNENNDEIKVYCPNEFTLEWIRGHYKNVIRNIIYKLFGTELQKYECFLFDSFNPTHIYK